MKPKTLGILSALILVLCFSLPTLAGDKGTITITMTGACEISITLDKTNWDLGEVASNTVHETNPPIEWCTLTVAGNCNVKTFIVGEDAKWVSNPTVYKWTLSNDGSNGDHIYGLWFRISGDTTRDYVPVTNTQGEFWPYGSTSSPLTPGETKQFGLR